MKPVRFRDWDCLVRRDRYPDGGIRLRLVDAEDGSPVATATVTLPDIPLGPEQVLIQDYSENAGMQEALVEAGVVSPIGQAVAWGHVVIPICEVQPPFRAGGSRRPAGPGRGR